MPPTYWTPERIVRAIQEWAVEHGRQPRRAEWANAGAMPDHPCGTTVYRVFGSWNAAIRAAGFRPARGGVRPSY